MFFHLKNPPQYNIKKFKDIEIKDVKKLYLFVLGLSCIFAFTSKFIANNTNIIICGAVIIYLFNCLIAKLA